MTVLSAEYFDGWYADLAGAPARDELFRRHLGLPSGFTSTSVLGLDGLSEIRAVLALRPGEVVLDLACGRGGYGRWLAGETGARLVGVDFSPEAIRQATEAGAPGIDAEFLVGALEATGLADASVDAVLCVDAVQFAADQVAAAAEIRRVLRPGGRVALTCWEPRQAADERLSERLRHLDLARDLAAGGLLDVHVQDRPTWQAIERALWQEAATVDAGEDRALQAMKAEGERVLPVIDLTRRVLATATAPTGQQSGSRSAR